MRGYALSTLGEALAQAQQWERAEVIWREAEAMITQIEYAGWRGKALIRLIEALSKANNHEHGLAVVQRAWLQATARDEALLLLQITQLFIVLKPELGMAFFEAFAWVDAFLKS